MFAIVRPMAVTSFFNKKPSKYKRGIRPCNYCNSSQHAACRPRLDGTLCTCNCPAARNIAEEVNLTRALARERGETEPSMAECVRQIKPLYKQQFV